MKIITHFTELDLKDNETVLHDRFRLPNGQIWASSKLKSLTPIVFNYLYKRIPNSEKTDWDLATTLFHLETGPDPMKARAKRLIACTKAIPCMDQHLCSRCRKYKANRLIRQILPMIEAARKIQNQRSKSAAPLVTRGKRMIMDLKKSIDRLNYASIKKKGRATKFKSDLNRRILKIHRFIESNLRSLLNVSHILKKLTEARNLAKSCGELPIISISQALKDSIRHLKMANTYHWVILFPTIKVTTQISDAHKILHSSFGNLWKAKLNAPFAGAIRFDEVSSFGNNVHSNVIYIGPYQDKKEIGALWKKFTGCKIRLEQPNYKIEKTTEAIIRYSHDPEKICHQVKVNYWWQCQGKHHRGLYGCFRG